MSPSHYGVSVSVAAQRLGVSEETIRRRLRSGLLKAIKDGRVWNVMLPESQQPHDTCNTTTDATSYTVVSAQLDTVRRENDLLKDQLRHLKEMLQRRDEEVLQITQFLMKSQQMLQQPSEEASQQDKLVVALDAMGQQLQEVSARLEAMEAKEEAAAAVDMRPWWRKILGL